MIPSLSPPTDNLYKFLAISGTIIVLVSIFWPLNSYLECEMTRFEVERDLVRLHVENEVWEGRVQTILAYDKKIESEKSRLKSESEESFQALESCPLPEVIKDEIYISERERFKAMAEDIVSLSARRNLLADKNIENASIVDIKKGISLIDNKQFELISWWKKTFLFWFSIIGIAFGLVMSACGYILWWSRIQRLQDKILLAECKEC